MNKRIINILFLVFILLSVLASCSQDSSPDISSENISNNFGQREMRLVRMTTDCYNESGYLTSNNAYNIVSSSDSGNYSYESFGSTCTSCSISKTTTSSYIEGELSNSHSFTRNYFESENLNQETYSWNRSATKCSNDTKRYNVSFSEYGEYYSGLAESDGTEGPTTTSQVINSIVVDLGQDSIGHKYSIRETVDTNGVVVINQYYAWYNDSNNRIIQSTFKNDNTEYNNYYQYVDANHSFAVCTITTYRNSDYWELASGITVIEDSDSLFAVRYTITRYYKDSNNQDRIHERRVVTDYYSSEPITDNVYSNYSRYEHIWDNGTTMIEPTWDEKGAISFTCLVCGSVKETETPSICDEVSTISDDGVFYISNPPDSRVNGIISIPSEVNGIVVTSIGNHAFHNEENGFGCADFTSINISNSVTSIGDYAFSNCTGLTSIEIPNSVTTIGKEAFSNCTGLTSIEIPNSVTTIGEDAFSWCTGLTSITIPNSITTIEEYVFSGCTGLTSITIPNSVTTIEKYAFGWCTGLTSITIPNSVTNLSGFYKCSGLTSITIPNSVTNIDEWAFSECTGLTTLELPNSVTTIGRLAFYWCSGLTSISIPSSVTEIGESAFDLCYNLESVTLTDSIMSIGRAAFRNCRALQEIIIPSHIEFIDEDVFLNCSGLTSIEIPNSVNRIGDSAFAGCKELTNIVIPTSVSIIEGRAFDRCAKLVNIYYSGTISQWNSINIYDNAFSDTTLNNYIIVERTIHCSDGNIICNDYVLNPN